MSPRALLIFLSTAFLACASAAQPPSSRGHLMLIGGGDKPAAAMAKFVELAGGTSAPIVVIPTASGEEDTPAYYLDLFKKELGSTDVVVLPIKEKADAERPEHVAAAARARGVFFAGGDQSRVTKALLGTPVLDAIRAAFRDGAVVGGTSAGTACQSRLMITGEGDFKVIREGAVELVEGLGLLPDEIIVDQHFIARQRENRLFTVILERPDHLGVGVDEDTAAWFRPDGTFEVIGEGSVMVLDARGSAIQRGAGEAGKSLLGAHGVRLHIVLPGEVFDTRRRAVVRASGTAASR
ncbi:MAG: cyanophycinase [Acidobacteria bacterium]|nr:cyanophycinase [Acidobacteriota bacterium]